MISRTARLRKEFLFRKEKERVEKELIRKKSIIKNCFEENKRIPTELIDSNSNKLYSLLDVEDANVYKQKDIIDDEYSNAGSYEPKILITTSRNASIKLTQLAKEMKLIFPNSEKINRGNYIIKDIISLAKTHSVSDIIILHEHRGIPDGMIVSHMPFGPTAYFNVSNCVMRHDFPSMLSHIPLVKPHLIFENLNSKIGKRIMNVLKHLFPPTNAKSKRVCTFANENDVIHFRHHVWSDNECEDESKSGSRDRVNNNSSDVKLTEIGPRMSLRLYQLDLGTVDEKFAENEWSLRPYFNKQKFALSDT